MRKFYTFRVNWGKSTTTDDAEGEEVSSSNFRPSKKEILNIIPKFKGEIKQVPPQFSAIKINGKRSYLLARKNLTVKHKARDVIIHDLELIKYINKDISEFKVSCSKGTYIRSLARDFAKELNAEAHIIELNRKSVGFFSLDSAILLDLSKKLIHSPLILRNIIPLRDVLRVLPSINLTKEEADKIKHGQKLSIKSLKHFKKFLEDYPKHKSTKTLYCCSNDLPIPFIEIHKNQIRPFKVFNV